MSDPRADDLKALADDVASDADELAKIEDEKGRLDPDDPEADELARRAQAIAATCRRNPGRARSGRGRRSKLVSPSADIDT